MTRRSLPITVLMLWFLSPCSAEQPSRTEVLCNQLLDAHSDRDSDRVESAVEAMLDLGTDEDPQGVEPDVYVHALLMQDMIKNDSQLGFNAELNALLAECRKAVA